MRLMKDCYMGYIVAHGALAVCSLQKPSLNQNKLSCFERELKAHHIFKQNFHNNVLFWLRLMVGNLIDMERKGRSLLFNSYKIASKRFASEPRTYCFLVKSNRMFYQGTCFLCKLQQEIISTIVKGKRFH